MAEAYAVELIDEQGRRKYHNRDERRALLRAAEAADAKTGLLIATLIYTGARLSEALAVCEHDVRSNEGTPTVRLRTLKKKKGSKAVYRFIPIPAALMKNLTILFNIGQPKNHDGTKKTPGQRLWPWSRQTAWKRIKPVMLAAGIDERLANARAIRSGYGVAAVMAKPPVPITTLSESLGHSTLASTRPYYQLAAVENAEAVQPMWADLE